MPNPAAAALPHPFDYTDQGNGTVLDHVTGLVWQKSVVKATQSFTWAAARTYCAGLTLPAPTGFTWHVPTRIQALSLVDYTTQAAMDGPFLGSGQPPSGMYTWTSTPWVVSQISTKPQDAWMVNFGGGGGLTSNAAAQSATEYVRCVASPAVTPLPYPHYVQVDAGEVMDVETGLVWPQASNLSSLSQSAAMAYCTSLRPERTHVAAPERQRAVVAGRRQPGHQARLPGHRPVRLPRYPSERLLHVLLNRRHDTLGLELRRRL